MKPDEDQSVQMMRDEERIAPSAPRHELTLQVLEALNGSAETDGAIEELLELIRSELDLSVAAIRLRVNNDFPHVESCGLDQEFLTAESSVLGQADAAVGGFQCLCGMVLSGSIDRKRPFSSPRGSFWTSDLEETLKDSVFADMTIRNQCLDNGHRSMALIPLRAKDELLGLMQLADDNTGKFSLELVKYLERIGASIGVALCQSEAAREARESEKRFRAVFDRAKDGICLISAANLAICIVNEEFCSMVGYSNHELIGKRLSELCRADSLARVKALLSNDSGGAIEELELLSKDGNVTWTELSLATFRLDDQLHGIGIFHDISDRRQAEEKISRQRQQLIQTDRLALLGVLVAGLGHEINNANGLVQTSLDILEPVLTDLLPTLDAQFANRPDELVGGMPYQLIRKELPRMLKSMRTGAERITRTVGELQDFAHQRSKGQPVTFSINEVILDAVKLTANTTKKLTRNVRQDLDEDLPQIAGNFQRLQQVVANLIVNACQALPDTDRSVVLRSSFLPDEGMVCAAIEDEGVGIRPEHVSRLTEPFFTTRRHEGGTGLGLAVCQGIVLEHNGRMEFESELGVGTVVKVLLPIASHEGPV